MKDDDHNDYDDRWLPLAFSMGKSNRGDEIAAAAASWALFFPEVITLWGKIDRWWVIDYSSLLREDINQWKIIIIIIIIILIKSFIPYPILLQCIIYRQHHHHHSSLSSSINITVIIITIDLTSSSANTHQSSPSISHDSTYISEVDIDETRPDDDLWYANHT